MKPKHPNIPMCACKSSQVSEIGHCPTTNTLAVRYKHGGYVSVMERNHNPTAHDEMMRMLDECARLGKENAALRSLLGEWYALFAPVRRGGTEGARLIDRTAEAMASEFRYKTPTF